MTKKSQGRIQRDAKAGKRIAQSRTTTMAPVSTSPMKPTEAGGYKISMADRILAECANGCGFRPQEKPKNTCWDDLIAVYRECAGILFQHTMVTEVMRDKELMTFVDDMPTFNANVKQFAADLAQMNTELQNLFGLHNGKSGGSEDPMEVVHSFGIFEQYKLWMTKHDAVVKPTIMHILEQTNLAELRRQQMRASSGLLNAEVPEEQVDPAVLDVNQITDVVFNDDNVGHVVGMPNAKRVLDIQAAIDAGLEASKGEFEVVSDESNNSSQDVADGKLNVEIKRARGMNQPIYQIDEDTGFMPIATADLQNAHHNS